MRRSGRKLLRRVSKNNQKGFTLIELLVVISILGILAAVVTMSMVGVTKLAQTRAADTEKSTVQAALDTMANEQLVTPGSVCTGTITSTPTADMTAFPATGTAGAGPAGNSVALYPRYLRQQRTHGTYTCNGDGVVNQAGYTP